MTEKKITSPDPERGKRFAEIVEKLFPDMQSRNARAKDLDFDERNLRAWESGANINNQMLAELARRGASLEYLFLGTGSPLRDVAENSAPRPTREAVGGNELTDELRETLTLLASHHADLVDLQRRCLEKPALASLLLAHLRECEEQLAKMRQIS